MPSLKLSAKAPLLEVDKEFYSALEKNPHLKEYVADFISKHGAIPQYYVQLSRDMRFLKSINIIYPVGDPIFIHIYGTSEDKRPIYHPVEPSGAKLIKAISNDLEEALVAIIDESYDYSSYEEHVELITKALSQIIEIDNSLTSINDFRVKKSKHGYKKIVVNEGAYEIIKYHLIKEKASVGILEPLIRDSYIEDISVSAPDAIFVEHKVFGSLKTTLKFDSEEDLNEYVVKLSERIGRPVSHKKPIVDAVLPDGSRINIVYGKDISIRGTNFTIRKFSEVPISVIQLCRWNTMSFLEAAYLWLLLDYGLSVWVCGETASGKTTTLKAITVFINPFAKIVSIEDTPEVVVPHENWVREVTRESEDKSSSITMYDLLKAALRQRPNYVIVGEIRGIEGSVAFQAMQTGHPVMSTFHAGSVEKLIQRLTGSPIEIPKTYIDNLNCVVLQSAVRHPKTGKMERRVISINEIVGYDPIEDRFNYIELFYWDPVTDRHEFRGEGMSYLIEYKVAKMMGLSEKEVRKAYHEMKIRAEFLKTLSDLNIADYYQVWNAVKKCRILGTEKALELLKKGALLDDESIKK